MKQKHQLNCDNNKWKREMMDLLHFSGKTSWMRRLSATMRNPLTRELVIFPVAVAKETENDLIWIPESHILQVNNSKTFHAINQSNWRQIENLNQICNFGGKFITSLKVWTRWKNVLHV